MLFSLSFLFRLLYSVAKLLHFCIFHFISFAYCWYFFAKVQFWLFSLLYRVFRYTYYSRLGHVLSVVIVSVVPFFYNTSCVLQQSIINVPVLIYIYARWMGRKSHIDCLGCPCWKIFMCDSWAISLDETRKTITSLWRFLCLSHVLALSFARQNPQLFSTCKESISN